MLRILRAGAPPIVRPLDTRGAAAYRPSVRLALFQPDIPQNAGTLMRLGACLDVGIDIVEPCGFALEARALRRAGLDYAAHARVTRHPDFAHLKASAGRIVLLTAHADMVYTDFAFDAADTLLLGRESAGVPGFVREGCGAAVTVPMAGGMRSLNVAVAGAMVLGEALRQTRGFPPCPAA